MKSSGLDPGATTTGNISASGLPPDLLKHPGLERKQHTGRLAFIAAQIVICEVIARVRLVDDLDHAVDRIHLGAGNFNTLRRNDGRARRADMLVHRGLSQVDPGAVIALKDPGWQAPEKAAEAFRASPNLAIPASSKGDCIIKLRGSWLVIPSFGGFASWLAKGEDMGGDHVKLRPMLVVSEFEFRLSTHLRRSAGPV